MLVSSIYPISSRPPLPVAPPALLPVVDADAVEEASTVPRGDHGMHLGEAPCSLPQPGLVPWIQSKHEALEGF